MPERWTEERLDLLKKLFRQGQSVAGAARVLGVKKRTLESVMQEHGISARWFQHEGRQARSAARKPVGKYAGPIAYHYKPKTRKKTARSLV